MKKEAWCMASACKHPLSPKFIVLLWVAVFFLWGAFTIKTYPPVNYNLGDEIWAVGGSLNYLKNPSAGPGVPSLYFSALGTFLYITGNSEMSSGGVFLARLFSLMTASFLIYLTYLAGRELHGEKAGLFSAILLGSSFAFLWQAKVARPEMMTAVFIVSAFYLLHQGLKKNLRFLAYSGLLTSLSVNVHPNNLQYLAGISVVYVLMAGKRFFSRATLFFLAGLGAGLLVWILFIYLPTQPPASITTLTDIPKKVYPFPFMEKNIFLLFKESIMRFPGDYLGEYFRRFDDFFPNNVSIYFFAILTAVLLCLSLFIRQRSRVLVVLSLPLVTAFFSYFITTQFGYWHIVEFYPFFALAMGIGVSGIKDAKSGTLHGKLAIGRWPAVVAWFFIMAFSLTSIADTLINQFRMKDYSYERIISKVSAAIPSGSRVVAGDFYAPALKKAEVLGIGFSRQTPYSQCPAFENEIKKRSADYIITDDVFRSFVALTCGAPYEAEMVRYLNLKCTLTAVIAEDYPSYWANDKLIKGIYVFRHYYPE